MGFCSSRRLRRDNPATARLRLPPASFFGFFKDHPTFERTFFAGVTFFEGLEVSGCFGPVAAPSRFETKVRRRAFGSIFLTATLAALHSYHAAAVRAFRSLFQASA